MGLPLQDTTENCICKERQDRFRALVKGAFGALLKALERTTKEAFPKEFLLKIPLGRKYS